MAAGDVSGLDSVTCSSESTIIPKQQPCLERIICWSKGIVAFLFVLIGCACLTPLILNAIMMWAIGRVVRYCATCNARRHPSDFDEVGDSFCVAVFASVLVLFIIEVAAIFWVLHATGRLELMEAWEFGLMGFFLTEGAVLWLDRTAWFMSHAEMSVIQVIMRPFGIETTHAKTRHNVLLFWIVPLVSVLGGLFSFALASWGAERLETFAAKTGGAMTCGFGLVKLFSHLGVACVHGGDTQSRDPAVTDSSPGSVSTEDSDGEEQYGV